MIVKGSAGMFLTTTVLGHFRLFGGRVVRQKTVLSHNFMSKAPFPVLGRSILITDTASMSGVGRIRATFVKPTSLHE